MPATEAWQERVDVPEPPVMLVGDRAHVRLVELVITLRLVVPVKPLTGDIVIVDVPVAPVLTETLVGLAVIVKSGWAAGLTLTLTVTP